MHPLVSFQRVSAGIGHTEILHDVSFDVPAGETLVLLGRSGSGKTTALKMVNGLLTPSTGAVLIEGRPTSEWDLIRLRRRIGYVIQEAGLFPHFTVAANIGLVPRLEGWQSDDIEARVSTLLTQLGLPPAQFRERYPRELSGGQRQRVGIARALAAGHRVEGGAQVLDLGEVLTVSAVDYRDPIAHPFRMGDQRANN